MQERKSAPLSDFYKFTVIGQCAVGRVDKFIPASGDMSSIIVLSPVLLTKDGGGLEQWERAAIGLSTDLSQKITARDLGKDLMLSFRDTEPTTKGSKKKIFGVFELSIAEIRELAESADKTHRQEPYVDESKEGKSPPQQSQQQPAEETRASLPF
jgi:hypothetical protein